MGCFPKMCLQTVLRCLCVVGMLVLLAGHLATLSIAYTRSDNHRQHSSQLLLGAVILGSALLLLPLDRLLPRRAELLRRAWLVIHVTYRDDQARLAVQVLYEWQVWPVIDALGLAAYAAPLDTLDYWWWSFQGLLLVAMAGWISRPAAEGDGDGEAEADGDGEAEGDDEFEEVDLTDVAVCDGRLHEAPPPALLPPPQHYCITLHKY